MPRSKAKLIDRKTIDRDDDPFLKGDKVLLSEPDNHAIWVLNDLAAPLVNRNKFPFRAVDFRWVVSSGK